MTIRSMKNGGESSEEGDAVSRHRMDQAPLPVAKGSRAAGMPEMGSFPYTRMISIGILKSDARKVKEGMSKKGGV
jgi:hypothetical protein